MTVYKYESEKKVTKKNDVKIPVGVDVWSD